MRKFTLLLMAIFALCQVSAQPAEESLWPGKSYAPGEFIPTVTFYSPSRQNAADIAVVVCPGGGYSGLAMDHEGKQIAGWLNSLGITAVVLKYHTVSGTGDTTGLHPAPLEDALRAIRLVRDRARKLDLSPDKIGIMGFSAGGHLASTAATHFTGGDPDAADPLEKISSRPDFAILVYPVITFLPPYAHQGSRVNLLGKNASDSLVLEFSNERQVSPRTPPVFLVHTTEDTVVPPENSIMFYQALRKAKVPVELHIFLEGRHGLGLGSEELPFSEWPLLCVKWLDAIGVLAGIPE
ncbi:alpha/beta hydrolase [Anseongella ginsenosidimutans]|nr:alpha/beta hydrolase [Anseongella ginsenosidimutans]QEC52002.1 alpha/beta hydrolase [Anseongella ginsenosidimutans]